MAISWERAAYSDDNYSLCILTICNSSYFPFGFEVGISLLIAPVPGHSILVTFSTCALSILQGVLRRCFCHPISSQFLVKLFALLLVCVT